MCNDLGLSDEQMDGSVMNALMVAYPALMTAEELRRDLREDEWRVTDSLNRLAGAGLIHRHGEFVFPTRSAYAAGKLDFSS